MIEVSQIKIGHLINNIAFLEAYIDEQRIIHYMLDDMV